MPAAWFSAAKDGLPALAVAAAAVGLAVLWLEVTKGAALGVAIAGVAIGVVGLWAGWRTLSGNEPRAVKSLRWFTLAALTPASIGAAAGAIVVVLGVELPKDDWPAQTRALVAAGTGAITTYLAAAFVRAADEADTSWVGTAVKSAFQRTFRGRFDEAATRDARDAVFSDERYDGWGRAARRTRAELIDAALAPR